jgi:hypothetical protein
MACSQRFRVGALAGQRHAVAPSPSAAIFSSIGPRIGPSPTISRRRSRRVQLRKGVEQEQVALPAAQRGDDAEVVMPRIEAERGFGGSLVGGRKTQRCRCRSAPIRRAPGRGRASPAGAGAGFRRWSPRAPPGGRASGWRSCPTPAPKCGGCARWRAAFESVAQASATSQESAELWVFTTSGMARQVAAQRAEARKGLELDRQRPPVRRSVPPRPMRACAGQATLTSWPRPIRPRDSSRMRISWPPQPQEASV